MSERRAHYRVAQRSGAMLLTVEAQGQAHTGTVFDTSAGGVSVSYPAGQAPHLPLGLRARLVFTGGPLDEPVATQGELRTRIETDEHRRYGFAFDSAAPFGGALTSPVRATFNRRRHVRVRSPEGAQSPVRLVSPETGADLVQGHLLDLSAGGLSALVPRQAEQALTATERVVCMVQLPGRDAPEPLACTIRNRTLVDAHVRYGLAFDTEGDATEATPPTYEPLWSCSTCSATGLLATTHPCCPQCGMARGDLPTWFPAWAGLAERSTHPFTGDALACEVCGATWSVAARFCGRCGERLERHPPPADR